MPPIPSICVGAPSSLGSSCRCWSPRRGREIFSVPDSLLRRRLSSAQSRRKKLGAHRIRCSCAYNSVQNNRLWALLKKNVADGGGGPMNESLPPTEPLCPQSRDAAARCHPSKPASDTGGQAKLRTHHGDKVSWGVVSLQLVAKESVLDAWTSGRRKEKRRKGECVLRVEFYSEIPNVPEKRAAAKTNVIMTAHDGRYIATYPMRYPNNT